MINLKIKDDVNLEELEKYGFQETNPGNGIYSYNIEEQTYRKDLYEYVTPELYSSIIVNDVNNNDRKLRFFFDQDIYQSDDIIDYDVEIPAVLFDLIQDGLVEKCGE